MAKKHDGPPPPPRPRNTVTLVLDGDDQTFKHNFFMCQAHFQYWLLCNSAFRARYGNKLIYTTPLQGTFYYVVRYIDRYVVFVIMARTAWLIGFCSEKGYFQVQSEEIEGLYMDSDLTKILHFNGNHKAISPLGTESTMINLPAARRRFSGLADYEGPTRHHDPCGFASHMGFFVVLLMESKCKLTYQRHSSAITGGISFDHDDDWVTDAVTNWSSISQQSMRSFDDSDHKPHDCGIRSLKNLDQLLNVFFYHHVDAYFNGLFEHKPMEPAPRKLTWDPVDMGVGDGDIIIHREPASSTSIRSRGVKKRVSVNPSLSIEERKHKKQKGLCGGGLGGPPQVPEVFLLWAYEKDEGNKILCDTLVSHLSLLGLNVLQAKRKLGTWGLEPLGKRAKGSTEITETEKEPAAMPTMLGQLFADFKERVSLPATQNTHSQDKESTENQKCVKGLDKRHGTSGTRNETSTSSSTSDTEKPKSALCSDDIGSLKPDCYLLDPVINWAFKELTSNLERNGINDVLLLNPALSYTISHDPEDAAGTATAHNLSSQRLVLFPVNDNENPDQAGGGKHWSLIVFDQWTQYGPRLLHYDSASNFNFETAHRISYVLRRHLPSGTANLVAAQTPQQDNDSDCGVFVIAIAAIICRWCEQAAVRGSEMDWSPAMHREIDAKRVAKLRLKLYTRAQQHNAKTLP